MFPEITFIVYDLTLSWGKKNKKNCQGGILYGFIYKYGKASTIARSSLGFIFVH